MIKFKTLRAKVEQTLKTRPETRDCDVKLTTAIWENWYGDSIRNGWVRLDAIGSLPREDHVSRVRRQVQNDRGMYLPNSWLVAESRNIAKAQWEEALGYGKAPVADLDSEEFKEMFN